MVAHTKNHTRSISGARPSRSSPPLGFKTFCCQQAGRLDTCFRHVDDTRCYVVMPTLIAPNNIPTRSSSRVGGRLSIYKITRPQPLRNRYATVPKTFWNHPLIAAESMHASYRGKPHWAVQCPLRVTYIRHFLHSIFSFWRFRAPGLRPISR